MIEEFTIYLNQTVQEVEKSDMPECCGKWMRLPLGLSSVCKVFECVACDGRLMAVARTIHVRPENRAPICCNDEMLTTVITKVPKQWHVCGTCLRVVAAANGWRDR